MSNATLSYADEQILAVARRENGGFYLGTKWYLRDWEPLPYQYVWHMLPYFNTTAVWGIGSGKTSIVTASNVLDCLVYPGFKALNASVTAKQAELAFEMLDAWKEGNTRLERLITDVTLRPWPEVTFFNGSTYSFRTAGLGAKFIRGHEYDRINYDEAGLDMDGEAVKVLRGRLRGRRPDGSARMARLDCTGTPSPSVWFKKRFDQGMRGDPIATEETLKDYFSMRVSTYENTKLTSDQIRMMEKEYPPEMIDIELGGYFPDWGMGFFPADHINACVNQALLDTMYENTRPENGAVPKAGYTISEWPRIGIVNYETPAKVDGLYIMAGDPGTGNPPNRNAPCIMVCDVSSKPKRIVAFWWGNAHGSYQPFLDKYSYFMGKYMPVLKGVDTTGTQTAIDELGFEKMGLAIDPISFSHLKDAMLNALSLDITGHAIQYPPIQGIINQLSVYRKELDKKLDQDIVMTMAQISHLSRFVDEGYRGQAGGTIAVPNRDQRSNSSARGRRSRS
jgi:hypothetical protein